ncbi:MAG TPA: diacylglycerol kinase family protein [Candidatus Avamphibacillus intestinigallinarum]|nr:diacylglycerol kinase family protein [Candidatus Avamphibacillus intestinigallinarum]
MKDKSNSSSFKHAFDGIFSAYKTEKHLRFHFFVTLFIIIFGFLYKLNRFEWISILIVIGLVIQAELLNTAVEKLLDYTKPEIHPTAKVIKDIAAGAVLIASITAAIVGIIIFLPKLLSW